MDKKIQIGKFSLRNPAVHHKRHRRAFQDRYFDARRSKVADNLAEGSGEVEILRYLSEVVSANDRNNLAGNRTCLGNSTIKRTDQAMINRRGYQAMPATLIDRYAIRSVCGA